MYVTSDFYAAFTPYNNTTASHYANTVITLLYLNDGNLLQSQSVCIDARGNMLVVLGFSDAVDGLYSLCTCALR